jgi:DNA helicase II / ATP-dependent DNA helicase PcrA
VILQLDDRHKTILEATSHALVLGGPGSGKTTLALLKALDCIDKGLRPGQGILFLSFSRAAVARVAEAAKDKLTAAQRSVLSIQTFHSFFWEILQTHGYLLDAPKRLSIVLAHDEKALRDGIERGDPGWNEWEVTRLRLFHEEGRLCFDLFAPLTAELLAHAKRIGDRIAKRYPLIIVDEAQDTANEQWACVKEVAPNTQVVCLADLDQLIFDHLPGVGPERVDQIRGSLSPIEVDLGTDNNRSPGTEIVVFARDVLHGRVRGAAYKNVSVLRFNAKAKYRDSAIRRSVGMINHAIRQVTGKPAESIGLIASYSNGVAIISAALRQGAGIPHQVLFDEAFVMLASRVGAFLLEPRKVDRRHEDIATFLDLLSSAYRAKGGKTALVSAKRFALWAGKARIGRPPDVNLVGAIDALLQKTVVTRHLGNPQSDWTQVKRALRASGDATLGSIAEALDYLVAFNRGQRIAKNLAQLWLTHGAYVGAREGLDDALAQEQLFSGNDQLHGIHVMNMLSVSSATSSSSIHTVIGPAVKDAFDDVNVCALLFGHDIDGNGVALAGDRVERCSVRCPMNFATIAKQLAGSGQRDRGRSELDIN